MSYEAYNLKLGSIFTLNLKLTLNIKVKNPKTIRVLTKDTCGPNLVFLAWTADELLRRQTRWRTDGRLDAGNDNTRRPKLALGKIQFCGTKRKGKVVITKSAIL